MKLPVNYERLNPAERRAAREQYVALQGGRCWFCGEPLAGKSPYEANKTKVRWGRFPLEFLKYPVHLHHDHGTGMTHGAVHAYCNAVSFDYVEAPHPNTPKLEPIPTMGKPTAPKPKASPLWFLGRTR